MGLLAGFGVAISGGAILLGIWIAVAGGDLNDPPPDAVIAATVFQDLVLVAAAILLPRVTQARGAWHYGFRSTRVGPAIGWMALTYVTFLGLTAAWLAFLDALGAHVNQSDELPSELGAGRSSLALAVVGVLVTVFAPIAEETFFRGFFFTALRNWKGVALAAIATGIVFGAIHFGGSPAAYLVPLGLFGSLLCLLYWRTGSLLPCIALHAINNSVAYGASQDWSWQIPLVALGALCLCGLVVAPIVVRANARPVFAHDPTSE